MRRLLIHGVLASALAGGLLCWANCTSFAQVMWTADGIPVCDSVAGQEAPNLISDGSGGAFVTWADQATGQSFDIRGQRLDANGNRLWPPNGVTICAALYDQYFPVIAPDGSGGAIIAWQDVRTADATSDIYAQRVDANGVVQWSADGVPICSAPDDQFSPVIASDGQGGAYIAWRDDRADPLGGTSDIYIQRVGLDGSLLWASDLPVATSPNQDDRDVAMVSGDAGGVVLVWQDGRNVSVSGKDVYAQRINSSGELLWGSEGLAVCAAGNDQRFPKLALDSSGDVVICWDDKRNGTDYDVYSQRVSASGTPVWTANGVPVCAVPGDQVVATIGPDGTGGAIVAWTDGRAGSSVQLYDIYSQRVTSSGTTAWTFGGIVVCDAQGWQGRVKSVSDGSGGVFLAWLDNRRDPTNTTYDYDIYAQHLNLSGVAEWAANGIAVCDADGRQDLHKMVEDGMGNTVILWQDARVDPSKDVYAQRVGTFGSHVLPVTSIAEGKDEPDETWLRITGKIVTAVFGNYFYVEEPERFSGIRVSAEGVCEGQAVDVVGRLDTLNGERVLVNASVSNPVVAEVPGTVMVTNKYLGGTALNGHTPGITGGTGLNNVGLLIKTTGRVGSPGTGFVYINDGSGDLGVKMDTSYLTSSPSGYVVVTGISSTEEPSPGNVISVLRPRRDADVTVH